MQWRFRVSSLPSVGYGHMTRSLALAEAFPDDYAVQFVLDSESCVHRWRDFLHLRGFSVKAAATGHESEASGVVFDGYGFHNSDFCVEKTAGNIIVIISDDREIYEVADCVVRPSVNDFDETKDSKTLAGCRYALLATKYQRSPVRDFTGTVENVLIMCGALDSKNLTESILTALSKIEFSGDVTVLLSAQATNFSRIKSFQQEEKSPFSLSIVRNAIDTFDHLVRADLVIGSGGQGLIERVALGVPSLTLAAAENQLGQATYIAGQGATYLIDRRSIANDELLCSGLTEIIKNSKKREHMSVRAKRLIDGKGAARVVEKLIQLTPSVYS